MPSAGTVLDGKYRLVRQLGAGGMGIVYEADHIRLRQPFAIKILQPEFAGEREFLMRFEREARAAALLRSPHVVRVFDVDVSPDGLTYMVMELLEGRDLAEEALHAPLAVPQLVDWIIQACAGLQEAHDNGIVHRDLKPANVFLTKIETGERIAKILDFGISKVEATSTSLLTNPAVGALGTPTFMAPEQIRGRRIDGRADLWALGVMLYRLLAERWPFVGKGDQAYMAAVIADPALPFELVRPDLPYELASVIMKALEKDVANRHQSANELAHALAPFGAGCGPLAAGASLPPGAPGPRRLSLPPAADLVPARRDVTAPLASPPKQIRIVLPGATMPDSVAAMDTIADVSRFKANERVVTDYATPYSAVSPPATAFEPSPTRAPRGGGRGLLIAACVASAIGFGAYTMLSSRSAAPSPGPLASSSAKGAAAGADLPPATLDLAPPPVTTEARAAPTGVPVEPSASTQRRRAPRGPASTAPGPSAAAPIVPPPPDPIPSHL